MDAPLTPNMPIWLMAVVVFCLLAIFNWLGFIYRKRQMRSSDFTEPSGMNILENSLLGLTALLLAFTFGMTASKFDDRRHIIVEESNHISTALLRCDLYPDSVRNLLRADFRQYIEARIAYYDAGVDEQKLTATLDTAALYSGRIWKRVAALSQDPANFVRSGQMIPALNNMIDIVTTRDAERKTKVPRLIFIVLFMFSLLSAFLSGYSNKTKHRNRLMIASYACMTTITFYLIFELDRTKQGLINADVSEQSIVSLREMLIDK